MSSQLSHIIDGLNNIRVVDDMARDIPYTDERLDREMFLFAIATLFRSLVARHGINDDLAQQMADDWAAEIVERERQIVARVAAISKTIPHSRTGPQRFRKTTKR